MVRYADRLGREIDALEWATLFENADYRRVRFEEIEGCQISTVWLGLNHEYRADAPPLIFETMIFGGPMDEEQLRYTTEEEAIAGHKNMVELVKSAYAKK